MPGIAAEGEHARQLIRLKPAGRGGATLCRSPEEPAMRSIPLAAALAALVLSASAAAQQPAAPAPAASAPGRVGPDSTYGWELMTPQERDAYREKMIAAPTRDECRRLRDEHIESMARRARNRGIKDLPDPRYDACGR